MSLWNPHLSLNNLLFPTLSQKQFGQKFKQGNVLDQHKIIIPALFQEISVQQHAEFKDKHMYFAVYHVVYVILQWNKH